MGSKSLEQISQYRPATTVAPRRSAVFGRYLVLETWHSGGREIDTHDHADATLNVVLAGGLSERIGSRSIDSGPGSGVVKPAGAGHANRYGHEPTRSLLIQAARWEDSASGADRLFSEVRELSSAWIGTMGELAATNLGPEGDRDVAESAVFDLLFELRGDDAVHATPRRDLHVLRDRIAAAAEGGQPLRIGALAAELGVSPSALSQRFRRHFGTTPVAFVRALRVRRARSLIRRRPCDSLAGVAAEAGFSDQPHLTRAFRIECGVTPGAFRRLVLLTA